MFFDNSEILPKIFQNLEGLLSSSGRIALAVSGGVDSLFLAVVVYRYYLERGWNMQNLHCIVVDHNLRENSASDAIFARKILRKIGYDNVEITKWKHGEILTAVEESARNARYDIISEFCLKNAINTVLLGHHLDDQIETFFLNLFRGSGTIGLGGMKILNVKNNISFIRPLLSIRKGEIITFMQENNISWVEDETNQDDKFARNKIRNILQLVGIDDTSARRILGAIFAIQDANDVIRSYVEGYVQYAENFAEISTKDAQKITKCEMVAIFDAIYQKFQTPKPRYEQIENVISLIKSIKLDGGVKFMRKIYLAEVEIIVTTEKIRFQQAI